MTFTDEFHFEGHPKPRSVAASLKRAAEHFGHDDFGVVRAVREGDACRITYKKGARNASKESILLMLS